jgi:hypothetical protein
MTISISSVTEYNKKLQPLTFPPFPQNSYIHLCVCVCVTIQSKRTIPRVDSFRSSRWRTGAAARAWARSLSGDRQLTLWLHRDTEQLSDRSAQDNLRVRCFCFANETEASENDDVDEAVILEADGGNDAAESLESVEENWTRDADVAICMDCGKLYCLDGES